MVKEATLVRHGYREVKSEMHAMQLLRREVKLRIRYLQRARDKTWGRDLDIQFPAEGLMDIKPGSWWKPIQGYLTASLVQVPSDE